MKQGYSYEKKGVKNYGLGLRMMEWESGEKLWYHNGWWHGNYTTYVRGENDSISIIALGNRQVKSVYSSFSLIGLLGDYPVVLEQNPNIAKNNIAKLSEDSLSLELNALKEKSTEKQNQLDGKVSEKEKTSTIDSSKHISLLKY
jgi:hypothetical protein